MIGPMLERLTGWIAANRELIAQRVEEVVTRLAAAAERFVSEGGLQDIATRIGDIVTGITGMVEAMGGWEKAAIGLGAVLTANLVLPLAAIATSLTAIGAFRAPGWMARMMGGAGLGAAGAVGAGLFGERAINSALGLDHEAYAAQRERGRQAGYDQLTGWLSAFVQGLRRNTTPGGGAQQRFGARGGAASAALPGHGNEAPGDRQRQAFAYFRSQGWSAEQAAGLVANLRHESGAGLNHRAVGDGGASHGIAQWRDSRLQDFRLWAGKDIRESSFEDQLAFVQHELTAGRERAAGDALRAAQSAAEAAATVSRRYERPARAEAEAAARASTAEGLLPRLQGPAAPSAAAPQRIDLRISGLPAGVTATTTTRDPNGGVRVERAMPGSLP
ncbi:phage tail tip lysozyme [Teichococcus aestuarii]|uniref:phage tail tip lysozyme n=1 Tax=Teichococcus aestuarii TaxID=568898 RepID=UPI003622E9EF